MQKTKCETSIIKGSSRIVIFTPRLHNLRILSLQSRLLSVAGLQGEPAHVSILMGLNHVPGGPFSFSQRATADLLRGWGHRQAPQKAGNYSELLGDRICGGVHSPSSPKGRAAPLCELHTERFVPPRLQYFPSARGQLASPGLRKVTLVSELVGVQSQLCLETTHVPFPPFCMTAVLISK